MDPEALQEIYVTYLDDSSPAGEVIRKLLDEVERLTDENSRLASLCSQLEDRMH